MLAVGSSISTADGLTGMTADRVIVVPMSEVLRRCDFTEDVYAPPWGSGSAITTVRSTGSEVQADINLTEATPGVRYFVRLVETPPPTDRCRPGNPGVAAGTIDTDAGGNGNVSLQEAVLPGATGAWVFMEGPPGEYYSSDILAPV